MVTVVKNPQGHKILEIAITGAVTSSAGDALVTSTSHGLSTGDHVYVDSDIDEYNGFWYVQVISSNTFKIREYATADFVEYFQDLDITYFETLPQEWSSIFLPIVYKLTNDRWPTNSVDTVRSISSTADDNGYLDITASGTIKTGMNILEYVKISNSPVATYNGVWQIVEVVSSSRVVIDAPYTASSLSGADIQYYYNNYQVKVKIYSGLPAGHTWEAKKPYEEVAELSLTPDDDNLCMFSVADKIQGKVAIKNNTTLYSLPLNLDAFTGYYISTAEAFDNSDNYTITTDESAFVDDTFEGYAIAGKLPFKNAYSGHFSDYVYVQDAPALWLTTLSRLMAEENQYFDISFIKNIETNYTLQIDKYIGNLLSATEDITYTDQGIGVYRIPIDIDGAYDSFCVSVRPESSFESVTLPALSTWANATSDPSDEDWTTGAAPTVTVIGGISTPEDSEILDVGYAFTAGLVYTVTVNFTTSGGGAMDVSIYIMNNALSIQFENTDLITSDGTHSIAVTFTATSSTTRIGIRVQGPIQNGGTIVLDSTEGLRQIDVFYITQEICIDIMSCPTATLSVDTNFRLLEDGSFARLLEDGDYRTLE